MGVEFYQCSVNNVDFLLVLIYAIPVTTSTVEGKFTESWCNHRNEIPHSHLSKKDGRQLPQLLPASSMAAPSSLSGDLPSETPILPSESSPNATIPPESSPSEVHKSPYALTNSDTSTLVLVSEPLTDDNYVSWSRSMMLALSIRNKTGFIDGSLPKPTGMLQSSWIRSNNIVISWILNSVSKHISASILFTDSAHTIWTDLKLRFQRKNGPRIFQLKRRLATISQENQSVTTYFSQLKAIWDEYATFLPSCDCACGGHKEFDIFFQSEFLMSFLMGLNDSFGPARSQLLLMDPLPSISTTFSLISQEEQHRALPLLPTPSIALAVNNSAPKDPQKRRERP